MFTLTNANYSPLITLQVRGSCHVPGSAKPGHAIYSDILIAYWVWSGLSEVPRSTGVSVTIDWVLLYIELVPAYNTKEDVETYYPISHAHHNETVRIPSETLGSSQTFWILLASGPIAQRFGAQRRRNC